MTYTAPLDDMLFVLNEICAADQLAQLPGHEDATLDTIEAVLAQAATFTSEVLAPLNQIGDKAGARKLGDKVLTSEGWQDAYRQFTEGGWNGVAFKPDYGGLGLPRVVASCIQEMLNAANMGFAICPLLTQGAIEAIEMNGSDDLKTTYLPKMVSGEWTGTMNLTEPQAGSDLAAVRTKAERKDDHYLVTGQKIFISYGDHDLTPNIIHLVLARLPDAPEGVKGISLFVVPKVLLNGDGGLGAPNDVRCVSIEHKLGIHASPTAVMSYGDSGGAVGYLVGEENHGLEYMFVMMNQARLSVGIQGLAIADRAYQRARAYAFDRVQGRIVADRTPGAKPIAFHPDVHRMLMQMRARCEAMRCLAYSAAHSLDLAQSAPSDATRCQHQARLDFLIPIVKAWCTETACTVASLGVQIHGGMGFVEETGAAQHFRDARITTIYEGTTGIQANDLIGRKIQRDEGATARAIIEEVRAIGSALSPRPESEFKTMTKAVGKAADAMNEALLWLLATVRRDPVAASAAATNFLDVFAISIAGALYAKSALGAALRKDETGANSAYLAEKISTAHYYCGQVMPEIDARLAALLDTDKSGLALYTRFS